MTRASMVSAVLKLSPGHAEAEGLAGKIRTKLGRIERAMEMRL